MKKKLWRGEDEPLQNLKASSSFEKLMVCEAALEAQTREGKKIIRELQGKIDLLIEENRGLKERVHDLEGRFPKRKTPTDVNHKAQRYDQIVALCNKSWSNSITDAKFVNWIRKKIIEENKTDLSNHILPEKEKG